MTKWLREVVVRLVLVAVMLVDTPAIAERRMVQYDNDANVPVHRLSNGREIQLVGLGCASGVREDAVISALEAGYRVLDTAQSYNWGYREDDVGAALQRSSVPRDQVFVQTKIHPEDLGYRATKEVLPRSFERLQVSYIDSVLIHKPHCWTGACSRTPEGTWQESWKVLEEFYDEGKIGAIGICDVTDSILDELLQQRIRPHIIQNWFDPFHQDTHIRLRCQQEGIQYQGYSTLGTQWYHFKGYDENPVLTNPTLQQIASSHNATIAQVVIRWATQLGVSVLPASRNAQRQASNLHSFFFNLSDLEMMAIAQLGESAPPKEHQEDNNKVNVIFTNQRSETVLHFWLNEESGEEVALGTIQAHDEIALTSYHKHRFLFKDMVGTVLGSHTIEREGGKLQRYTLVDAEEEL